MGNSGQLPKIILNHTHLAPYPTYPTYQRHLPASNPSTTCNIPTSSLSVQPLYHSTDNLQCNLPGPTTSIPIPQVPSLSMVTMNINNPAMPPLLQMPIHGAKLAPPLFKGKYSKVTCFV